MPCHLIPWRVSNHRRLYLVSIHGDTYSFETPLNQKKEDHIAFLGIEFFDDISLFLSV